MKSQVSRPRMITGLYLLFALTAFTGSGCLLVAAGAAGGAVAGYAYVRGRVWETYNAGFPDAWAATRTALTELAMPILSEEVQGQDGFITSRTTDGDRVRIRVEAMDSRIPAEGMVTRVSVRVGTFGDHPVSIAVLEQIGRHLAPAAAPVAAPTAAPTARLGVIQAGATAEPPLASPVPSPGVSQTAAPPSLPVEPVPVGKAPSK